MKKLLAFILLALPAFGQVFTNLALQNSPGGYAKIAPYAQIQLCYSTDSGIPCTNKAPTFTTDALSTTCALSSASGMIPGNPTSGTGCNNPGSADSDGNFTLFATAGLYRLCITSGTVKCQEVTVPGAAGGNVAAAPQFVMPYYPQVGSQPNLAGDNNITTDGNGNQGVNSETVHGTGAGKITMATGTPPSNPISGQIRLYGDSALNSLKCLTSGGGNGCPSFMGLFAQAAQVPPISVNATVGPSTNGNNPFWWMQRGDGTYDSLAGLDTFCDASGGPPCDGGSGLGSTLVFYKRMAITDTKVSPISFKNSLLALNHTAGVGTVTTNQDRGMSFFESNPVNDSATRYGLEGMQAELDFNCNGCTINGSPDGEVSTTSWQLNSLATTSYSTSLGTNAVRAEFFRNGANMDVGGNNVFNGIFANNVSSNPGGFVGAVYKASCVNSFATQAGLGCAALIFSASGNRFLSGQLGLFSFGSLVPGSGDWLIRNDVHGFNSNLNGNVGLNEIHMTDLGSLPINASFAITGAATVSQIASSWASSYNGSCSGGASTYGYTLVAVDSNGGTSNSAAIASGMTACTNPLTGGNPVTLSPNTPPYSTIFAQAARIDVYRTTGPMGLGKVGTLSCNNNMPIFGCNAFSDTGIAATTALPSGNTTGGISAGGDHTFTVSKGQHFNTFAAASDSAGTCTASAATTCTVTFTRAYTSAPVCTATDSTNITTLKVTPSTSSLIITTTGSTSDVFDYVCSGNPN